GISYVTSNKGDAFALSFGQMETFAVDYMEKNLRVKQKGGRTWNFTDKAANADALFVFHREVDTARKKLAEGYTPVKCPGCRFGILDPMKRILLFLLTNLAIMATLSIVLSVLGVGGYLTVTGIDYPH